jgi:hypothetical protein
VLTSQTDKELGENRCAGTGWGWAIGKNRLARF